jgi:secreted trypsin-like serine protease
VLIIGSFAAQSGDSRVIGGQRAELGQFPYMASVRDLADVGILVRKVNFIVAF